MKNLLSTMLVCVLLGIASCSAPASGGRQGDVLPGELQQQRDTQTTEAGTEAETAGPGGTITAVVNEQYWVEVRELLDNATESIRVVHFELNKDSAGDVITSMLIDAQDRGLDVQVLLEDDVDSNTERVKALTAAGVRAKLDSTKRTTHTKLLVTDGNRALLGSTNWSYSSMRKNNETNVLIENDELCGYFANYADALYASPDKSPSMPPMDSAVGRGFTDGDYLGEAKALLGSAKTSISLLIYGINLSFDDTDTEMYKLAALMQAAAEKGVTVKVILEKSDYNPDMNAVNAKAAAVLMDMGLDVRYDPLGTISHAKLLLVDDTAIVGSNNWGNGGFFSNHEIGVRTSDPGVVKDLGEYFDGIWEESSSAAE